MNVPHLELLRLAARLYETSERSPAMFDSEHQLVDRSALDSALIIEEVKVRILSRLHATLRTHPSAYLESVAAAVERVPIPSRRLYPGSAMSQVDARVYAVVRLENAGAELARLATIAAQYLSRMLQQGHQAHF